MRENVKLIIIGLLSFFSKIFAEQPLQCNLVGPKSATIRLRRSLFCEYDSSVRPVVSKESSVNVSVSLSPKFMDFNDKTSTFILHSWVFIYWKDEHLTWKPDDFEKIERIKVKSDEIWVPDISVYNSGNMDLAQSGVPNTMCQLLYTGLIICVPSIKYSTQCDTDYTYWPYDTQKCSIRMGSWTHTGEEISFDFRKKSINMIDFTPNKEWLVTNYTTRKHNPKFTCCPNDTFPTLIIQFDLKRHSPMIHAVFVTPAMVLMVITLTVFWLDSRFIERISLAAVNFVCHILVINSLHWLLPYNGNSTPHILLFYRDSMVMATIAMIVTILLRKLQSSRVVAPNWILSTIAAIANSPATRFMLLDNNDSKDRLVGIEEDPESNDAGTTKKSNQNSWRKFAVIVEWIGFFSAVLFYALILLTLVPMFDGNKS